MRCPVCHILLSTADWKGVEVDFCPKCWGIWLDRGELTQIVQRSGEGEEPAASLPVATASPKPQPARPAHVDGPGAGDPSTVLRALITD